MPKRQKDGRYRAKLTVARGEKPVWLSARTLRELEDKKQQARRRYVDGARPRDISFHQLVLEWFELIKKPRIRRPSTLQSYLSAINAHLLPHFSPKTRLRAVRRGDLQRCLDALSGASSTTAVLVLAVMRSAMAYALAERLIDVDPSVALVLPQSKAATPKAAFTPQQAERLLNAAATEPFGLLIYVLYYLGCRRGEALALTWGDFDWDARTVHIRRAVDFAARGMDDVLSAPKSKAGERMVPMPDALVSALAPHRGTPDALLFGTADNRPISQSAFRARWSRLMRAAGLTGITPHWFRHNYITACVLAGVPPEVTMHIVGHADYRTTVNVYTHVQNEHKQRAVVLLDGVLLGPGCPKVAAQGAQNAPGVE